MSSAEREAFYDYDNKEWQIRTYEGEEERTEILAAHQSIAPKDADMIGYDSKGNVILRDDRSIRKDDLSDWRFYQDDYGNVDKTSVGTTVG